MTQNKEALKALNSWLSNENRAPEDLGYSLIDHVDTIKSSLSTKDGYRDAFYKIGELLNIPAQSKSPKEVLETQILPRIAALQENEGANVDVDALNLVCKTLGLVIAGIKTEVLAAAPVREILLRAKDRIESAIKAAPKPAQGGLSVIQLEWRSDDAGLALESWISYVPTLPNSVGNYQANYEVRLDKFKKQWDCRLWIGNQGFGLFKKDHTWFLTKEAAMKSCQEDLHNRISPLVDKALMHQPVEGWNKKVLELVKGQFKACWKCNSPFHKGSSCAYCGEQSPHVHPTHHDIVEKAE